MGLKAEADASTEEQSVVPISHDQLYVDDERQFTPDKQGEAAAITMAKQAAQSFVQKHPETQVFDKKKA